MHKMIFMPILCHFFAIFLVLSIASPTFAQDPQRWTPTQPPEIDFTKLVVAKVGIEDGKPTLMIIEPQWKAEKRFNVITVDVPKSGNGFQTESQNVERAFWVQSPQGTKKKTIQLDFVQAWDLLGRKLTKAEVQQRLAVPTHVILFPGGEAPKVSPYFATMFNENLMFISDTVITRPGRIIEYDPFDAKSGGLLPAKSEIPRSRQEIPNMTGD